MDDIDDRLRKFEPVNLDEDASLDDASLGTDSADELLDLFTRLTKGQWKTRQKADHAAQKVADYLDDHGDRVTDLKEERAALEDREEKYERFLLDVMDLFAQLEETAQRSDSDDLQSATQSVQEKLESRAEKIGLKRIPCAGKPFDSRYHSVVDTRKAGAGEEPDTIVEVVRPGYLLRGEVLRKAKVIEAK